MCVLRDIEISSVTVVSLFVELEFIALWSRAESMDMDMTLMVDMVLGVGAGSPFHHISFGRRVAAALVSWILSWAS